MPADDLRARLTETLSTTIVKPDGSIETATDLPWDRHDKHRFLYNCAVCQGNIPAIITAVLAELLKDPGNLPTQMAAAIEARVKASVRPERPPYDGSIGLAHFIGASFADLAEAAMSVRWEDHAATVAENAELRRRAEHAEGELSALRDHHAHWEAEKARADQAEAEIARARNVITALPEPGTVEELREKIIDLFGSSDEALVHAFLNYTWSETARIAGWEMRARWQTEAERDTLMAAIEQVTSDWKLRAREATAWVGAAKNHVETVRWNAWATAYECLAAELLAALAVPESTEEPAKLKHIGGRANAEDCPACTGDVPYPWICPGEPEGERNEYVTCSECGREPIGNYPVAHEPSCSRMTLAPHLWPSS